MYRSRSTFSGAWDGSSPAWRAACRAASTVAGRICEQGEQLEDVPVGEPLLPSGLLGIAGGERVQPATLQRSDELDTQGFAILSLRM